MCFRKYAHRLEISAVVRRRDPNTHSLFVSHSLVWVRETNLQVEDASVCVCVCAREYRSFSCRSRSSWRRFRVCVWVCVCVQRESTSFLCQKVIKYRSRSGSGADKSGRNVLFRGAVVRVEDASVCVWVCVCVQENTVLFRKKLRFFLVAQSVELKTLPCVRVCVWVYVV